VALISKEAILQAKDLPFEDCPVPEWQEGATARIGTMTGMEKDDWDSTLFTLDKDGKTQKFNQTNFRANLLARTLINEDGSRMFATAEEVLALGGKSSKVLDRLYQVAKRLNAVGTDEEAAVEKN
jgi:hypothetical protein